MKKRGNYIIGQLLPQTIIVNMNIHVSHSLTQMAVFIKEVFLTSIKHVVNKFINYLYLETISFSFIIR